MNAVYWYLFAVTATSAVLAFYFGALKGIGYLICGSIAIGFVCYFVDQDWLSFAVLFAGYYFVGFISLLAIGIGIGLNARGFVNSRRNPAE